MDIKVKLETGAVNNPRT